MELCKEVNLWEEFLQYVPACERKLFEKAVSDFDNTYSEELIEALSSHDCKVQGTKENNAYIL